MENLFEDFLSSPKIQQTKILVTCQRFDDLFLFGLVWQYSSIQKNIIKVGSKSWILTCSCHITLSLPFYTDPASKRELNFSNGYLSLLYFWSSLNAIISTNESTEFIAGHVLYKLAYTYKFRLKTTLICFSEFRLWVINMDHLGQLSSWDSFVVLS